MKKFGTKSFKNINDIGHIIEQIAFTMKKFDKIVIQKDKWHECKFFFKSTNNGMMIDEFKISTLKKENQ